MAKAGKISKAVIAVAGYGTRFLPATKNSPKEMLPIIDKPVIQYLVEECVDSGIENIILVTRFGQSVLENHFDSNVELEQMLKANGKTELLKRVQKVSQMANIMYVRQRKHFPYGNGTPLLPVKDIIDEDESFIFMWGDDMVLAKEPATAQLLDVWEKNKDAVILGAQEVSEEEVSRYGIIKIKEGTENEVESLVEKPNPEDAPSRLAQYGRFVLNHQIIDILWNNFKENKLGKDNELWLTDAIAEYNGEGNKVLVAPIEGKWVTTGDPLRYLRATVDFALAREDIGEDFRNYLKSLKL
jgi:UTP--glucose-1-phosphate uridylyltransferase